MKYIIVGKIKTPTTDITFIKSFDAPADRNAALKSPPNPAAATGPRNE
jgi:hypothetical protein